MPEISFNVSAVNAEILREALAFHRGCDVAEISNLDVRDFAGSHLRRLVQAYRAARRDSENPIDTSDPLV